jgi:hypothetical protein
VRPPRALGVCVCGGRVRNSGFGADPRAASCPPPAAGPGTAARGAGPSARGWAPRRDGRARGGAQRSAGRWERGGEHSSGSGGPKDGGRTCGEAGRLARGDEDRRSFGGARSPGVRPSPPAPAAKDGTLAGAPVTAATLRAGGFPGRRAQAALLQATAPRDEGQACPAAGGRCTAPWCVRLC